LVDTSTAITDVIDKLEIFKLKDDANLQRLKEQIIIPKHSKPTKTITLIKLFTVDFEFSNFVSKLLDCLNPEVEIRISLSFTMSEKGRLTYVFPIPAKPFNNKCRIIRNNEDKAKFLKFCDQFSYKELLDSAFTSRNTKNPFAESGYVPKNIVSVTFWITKWSSP